MNVFFERILLKTSLKGIATTKALKNPIARISIFVCKKIFGLLQYLKVTHQEVSALQTRKKILLLLPRYSRRSPPTIVEADLETPGMTASVWKIPMANDCL